MTFLPIVDRELRVAARRRGTYWSRTFVAMIALGVGMWIYLMSRHGPTSGVGIAMFIGLTIVTGLFCLFSGVQATADCLSEEKRDGTMGLLFLTDLKGLDVVAGKLAANSLGAFYGLLASFPVLAIPLLMGGVTGAEFWRMAIVLCNTMFFSLAAGMFASALNKSSRHAASLTLGIIVGIAGLLPLTAAIISAVYEYNTTDEVIGLLLPSPGYAFVVAFEQNYRGQEDNFLISVILAHAFAWFFLIGACLSLPRSWQEKAASVTRLRWRDRWLRWSLGNSAERASFRARLLDENAFHWLVSRSRIKPAMVWALLGVLGCGWIWGWMEFKRDWINPGTYIFTALVLNTLLKCWFSAEAVSQLAEDRRIGGLELLLSTPLDVRDILRGQFLALCRQFLLPLLLVIGVELVFMFAALTGNDVRGGEGEWCFVWIAGLIMLVADLAALFYVSQWQALTARSGNRANTASLARILALPWILYGMFLMLIALSAFRGGGGPDAGFFIFMWLMIGLGVDLLFGLRAKLKLETEFRAAATTRYTKPESFWKALFGQTRTAPDFRE